MKNRPFADAIHRALARADDKGDFCTLNALAEKLIEMAAKGDMAADQGDRRPL